MLPPAATTSTTTAATATRTTRSLSLLHKWSIESAFACLEFLHELHLHCLVWTDKLMCLNLVFAENMQRIVSTLGKKMFKLLFVLTANQMEHQLAADEPVGRVVRAAHSLLAHYILIF